MFDPASGKQVRLDRVQRALWGLADGLSSRARLRGKYGAVYDELVKEHVLTELSLRETHFGHYPRRRNG